MSSLLGNARSAAAHVLSRHERVKAAAERTLGHGLDVLCTARAAAGSDGARLRPSFVIVGGQRCGTTSMYNYLSDHPHVVAALTKEVHYFDVNMRRGWGWYEAHFPSRRRAALRQRAGLQTVTGEASPYYMFHPHALRRLVGALPDAKVIVMLRDPVQRAISHYWHERAKGAETASFEEALRLEESRMTGEWDRMLADETYNSFGHQHYSYLTRGNYLPQLQRVYDHFPAEQVYLVNSNEFYADPDAGYRALTGFLGLPEQALPTYKRYNTYDSAKPDPALVAQLVRHFAPVNAALYAYLGRDLGWSR